MVKEKLEAEVLKVMESIKRNENFLLSGGAGSGKTYSLVQIIKEVINLNPTSKIACITYTNAAVKEIEQRISYKNLSVSTIHDFLWDTISPFQKDMKESLLELINDPESKIRNPNGDIKYSNDFRNGIQYKEYVRINTGEISHDEVLILANYMYKKYPRLCDIVKDKYQYIFVDEYQDTSPLVIEILLESLQNSNRKNVVGLFGDLMQAIYDEGIGDVNKYIETGIINEVQKVQNRRNPKSIIDLSNMIRIDNLTQQPSDDFDAPNMKDGKIKEGNIKFVYSKDIEMRKVYDSSYCKTWHFNNPVQTKELRLTHNLIAGQAGFSELMDIYDSDPIVKFKKDIVDEIKKKNISIKDEETFDNVINQLNLTYKSGINKDRSKKDVKLEDSTFNDLYNIVKDWPFSKVKNIYFDKDNLIDDKKEDYMEERIREPRRDKLIQHLFKIQNLLNFYKNNQYNDFLKATSYTITTISDKTKIRDIIDKFDNIENDTIESVIKYADEQNLCKIDDKLEHFIHYNDYLYERVKKVKYKVFKELYNYLEGYVPLSTQHKIKGTEFDNVLVILDNGGWSKYNFEYLFNPEIVENLKNDKRKNFPTILERTKKLFYVCCTRAKENLVVYYPNPNEEILVNAEKYFGRENVINLDNEYN
ncbi:MULTISPECIES: UvrD-helicase domain-containing protein [Clostridium]|uniref:ATP-dependent helicase n=1 Tax=Clostridium butyricum TaxID=1492 RepID=A0A2S7F6S9_CLOBU|nr:MULTISPECIES: UvrD-helicase domain-containing protein [Clostridium]MDU4855624.1 AAA family ATPase [Clostridioides difficile]KHD13509.1 DNA/RNA helicase [Clostridium butyricum]MBS4841280.1 ATP-dependent helicase [Clostridium sp.]MBZ5747155.1 AAA family ATPase [Clostridium butyricum]MDU1403513.1 AAA family ATPase [Clostridium sp.]